MYISNLVYDPAVTYVQEIQEIFCARRVRFPKNPEMSATTSGWSGLVSSLLEVTAFRLVVMFLARTPRVSTKLTMSLTASDSSVD